MSDPTLVLLAKGGKQTSNNQWEVDTSVSYLFIEPAADPKVRAGYRKLERPLVRGDGRAYSRILGPKETAISFELLMRGHQAGIGSGVTGAYLTKLEFGWLLDSMFGSAGVNGIGTTVTAQNAGTKSITLTDRTGFPVGNAILVSNGTELIAREIVTSGAGAGAVIVDRTWTGTVAGVAAGSASWFAAPENINHIHTAWDVEGDNWRRKLTGCLGNMKMKIPNTGEILRCMFDLKGTDWSDPGLGIGAFTAPVCGTEIKAVSATIMFGDTEYNLIEAEVDLGNAVQPRVTPVGVNGFLGYTIPKKSPTLTGKFQFGALTAELTNTLLGTFRAQGTQDVSIQVGGALGEACLWRFPAADFLMDIDQDQGQDIITFSANITRAAAGNGDVRFHVF